MVRATAALQQSSASHNQKRAIMVLSGVTDSSREEKREEREREVDWGGQNGRKERESPQQRREHGCGSEYNTYGGWVLNPMQRSIKGGQDKKNIRCDFI